MAYQKQQPKQQQQYEPLKPGCGNMWKNKYKTTAEEDKIKPDYQGEVVIPGDQQGQTRQISIWFNKYEGGTRFTVRIAEELKSEFQARQQPSRPQPVNNQQNDDIDLPF
jgi:hypothetical protein